MDYLSEISGDIAALMLVVALVICVIGISLSVSDTERIKRDIEELQLQQEAERQALISGKAERLQFVETFEDIRRRAQEAAREQEVFVSEYGIPRAAKDGE